MPAIALNANVSQGPRSVFHWSFSVRRCSWWPENLASGCGRQIADERFHACFVEVVALGFITNHTQTSPSQSSSQERLMIKAGLSQLATSGSAAPNLGFLFQPIHFFMMVNRQTSQHSLRLGKQPMQKPAFECNLRSKTRQLTNNLLGADRPKGHPPFEDDKCLIHGHTHHSNNNKGGKHQGNVKPPACRHH